MPTSNNLPTTTNKVTFSMAMSTDGYKNLINRTIQNPKEAQKFISAITSAVAVNPALQECTPKTILAGALLGNSLNLSPSPQLGQYYLVPFKNKVKVGEKYVYETAASFILGWKGYLQLAIRSGYYKRINVMSVKQGELKKWNPFTEEFEVAPIEDENERANTPTIGYVGSFEYLNGFTKTIYWSYEKMLNHADTYSKAFSKKSYEDLKNGKVAETDMWKYSSFWYKDFDAMALKTVLRNLISHWGIMSTEMQSAFEHDESVSDIDNGNVVFGTPEAIENAGVPEAEEVTLTDVSSGNVVNLDDIK